MNPVPLFLIILIPLLLICGCSNNKPITEESILQKADEVLDKGKVESAMEYNDFLLGAQAKAINGMLALNSDASSEASNLEIDNFIQLINTILKNVNSIDTYKHGKDFKEAIKEQLYLYKDIAKNDFLELFELGNRSPTSDEEMQELSSKIEAILKRIEEKETPIDIKVENAQIKFAKKYNFKLYANELQEKLDSL
jgi:hypothetical protein